MARKQDWSPRGVTIDRCDVTLEYDQLPHDHPQALEEIAELKRIADPGVLKEEYEILTLPEAQAEADRLKKLILAYRKREWWYVRIFAHTVVMYPDPKKDYSRRVVTSGDYFESNWEPSGIRMIEKSELLTLYELLRDLGIQCLKFWVLRLGTFNLQHPKAPTTQTFMWQVPSVEARRLGPPS